MFQHDLPQEVFQEPQAELGVFGVDFHGPSVWLLKTKLTRKQIVVKMFKVLQMSHCSQVACLMVFRGKDHAS